MVKNQGYHRDYGLDELMMLDDPSGLNKRGLRRRKRLTQAGYF